MEAIFRIMDTGFCFGFAMFPFPVDFSLLAPLVCSRRYFLHNASLFLFPPNGIARVDGFSPDYGLLRTPFFSGFYLDFNKESLREYRRDSVFTI